MVTVSLRSRLEAELAYAAQARARGKEGRARVCARRAAGWAVAEYRRRLPGGSNSGAAPSKVPGRLGPQLSPPPGHNRTQGTMPDLLGELGPEGSALSHLRWLRSQLDQPQALRQAASRLTARVRPDQRLPHEQDPLEDARSIAEAFLTLIERQGSTEAVPR